METKNRIQISILSLIMCCFCLIASFIPHIMRISDFYPIPESTTILIFGGFESFPLFGIASFFVLLEFLRVSKYLYSIGLILLGITLGIFIGVIFATNVMFAPYIGFYILLGCWIGFLIILRNLYKEEKEVIMLHQQSQQQSQTQQQQQQQSQQQKITVNIQQPTLPQTQPSEPELKYCSSCGDKIKKTATFCEHCGAQQ